MPGVSIVPGPSKRGPNPSVVMGPLREWPETIARSPEESDCERGADRGREEDSESGDDEHEEVAGARKCEYEQIERQHRAAESSDPAEPSDARRLEHKQAL